MSTAERAATRTAAPAGHRRRPQGVPEGASRSQDRRVDPAILLRAVRRARVLSQRELAQTAGVSASTIDRIESGQTRRPSLRLVEDILAATGYRLVVVDHFGRLFEVDEVHARLRDRSDRRFPAHLEAWPLTALDPWWGWSRIAWGPEYPNVPSWVYYRRRRYHTGVLWEDAT
jgi:transcriptional regulator with XRE-family HTH domain